MSIKLLNKLADQYTGSIFGITFFASLLIMLCLIAFRFMLIFTYNGEIGGIDNNFVYGVIRSMAGYNIYPNPEGFPYAVNPYSPLYYNLCSAAGNMFDINIEDPINVYRLCRAVSFTCDLLTCIVFFQTIKKAIGIKKEIALLATSVLACLLCYLGYTFSRADSLFLLFYTLLISILLKKNVNKGSIHALVLALLSIGCIFSKQNGMIAPVLVVTGLLIDKKSKLILWYLLFYSALMTATLLFYLNIANYTYLLEHIVSGINNQVDLSWFYVTIFKRLADSLIILLLYAGLILSLKWIMGKAQLFQKKLSILFIFQTIFSLGISLKWGSSIGYFNESFLLAILLITQYVVEANEIREKKFLTVSLPLYILFFIHIYAQGYLFFIQDQNQKKQAYLQQREIRNYLQPKLSGKYLLDLGNENGNFFKTLFYKESFVPNYDAVSCCTFPRSTFNYSAMLNDLQNGNVKFLIIPEKEFIHEIWGISLDLFKKDTVMYGQNVFSYARPYNK
jgi:hypothetical protein